MPEEISWQARWNTAQGIINRNNCVILGEFCSFTKPSFLHTDTIFTSVKDWMIRRLKQNSKLLPLYVSIFLRTGSTTVHYHLSPSFTARLSKTSFSSKASAKKFNNSNLLDRPFIALTWLTLKILCSKFPVNVASEAYRWISTASDPICEWP